MTDLSTRRGTLSGATAALVTSGLAGAGLASLVMLADPGTREQELFTGLLLVMTGALGTSVMLAISPRSTSPFADTLRALRRGLLFGLACAGAVVLRLNGAFSAPNLAFLLLMLLIAEMIFLARRQNPA